MTTDLKDDEPEKYENENDGGLESADNSARAQLNRLIEKCRSKRKALYDNAAFKIKRRKSFQVAAGVLALLAATSATGVVTALAGETAIRIITTLLAFVSGLINLLILYYASDKDAEEMFEGASQYLSLRDRLRMEVARKRLTDAQLQSSLSKFIDEYGKLSKRFDRHIPHDIMRQY